MLHARNCSGDSELVEVNPPGQYADDRNLRARQRLWRCQVPFFDIAAWVLDLAGLAPGWRIPAPTRGTFTVDNAAAQLGVAFRQVTCVRPAWAGPVVITDASVAADYVASLADHYQPHVARPWGEVAEDVGEHVQAVIDAENEFRTAGDMAAFVCR
jgi:hypothetical protein